MQMSGTWLPLPRPPRRLRLLHHLRLCEVALTSESSAGGTTELTTRASTPAQVMSLSELSLFSTIIIVIIIIIANTFITTTRYGRSTVNQVHVESNVE